MRKFFPSSFDRMELTSVLIVRGIELPSSPAADIASTSISFTTTTPSRSKTTSRSL